MELQGRNLALRMRGDDVALLQRELQQLGLVIDRAEIDEKLFGPTTHDAVLRFQREHRLEPISIVDELTARHINAEIESHRQPSPREAFVVKGTLKNPDDSPVAGAVVKAVDVGLRSETPLGETRTNADGKYEIHYGRDQLRPETKRAADLIVRAFTEASAKPTESKLICSAPPEVTVDLVVGNVPLRGPTEYIQLLKAITPYLGETNLADLEQDDVAFLACSAQIDRVQVATLVVANRRSRDTNLPDWLFYALGRQGIPLDLTSMLALSAARLKEAIDRAIAANTVEPVDEQTETALLDRLHAELLKEAFREDLAPGTFSIGALLDAWPVDRPLRQEFLSRYIRREGTLEDFWKSLEEDERFKGQPLEDLRFTLVLGRLTGYLIPALQQLKVLRQRQELAEMGDLAKLTRPRWRELLRNAAGDRELELPDVTGANYAERVENYISGIRNTIETMLPGKSLSVALQTAPETADDLRVLLQNSDSLDLYWDNIDAKLAERGEAAFRGIDQVQHESVVQNAKALQRLVRLSPHPDRVRILHAAGFHSAYSIAHTPRQRFNQVFAETAEKLWDSLDGGYTIEIPDREGEVR